MDLSLAFLALAYKIIILSHFCNAYIKYIYSIKLPLPPSLSLLIKFVLRLSLNLLVVHVEGDVCKEQNKKYNICGPFSFYWYLGVSCMLQYSIYIYSFLRLHNSPTNLPSE